MTTVQRKRVISLNGLTKHFLGKELRELSSTEANHLVETLAEEGASEAIVQGVREVAKVNKQENEKRKE